MKIQLDDRIISSDAFLLLSHTAQCLYYALFRTRDGDGVVNKTKSVMMAISQDTDVCGETHLKELVDGSFIIDFRKTDGVVVIKHHWLHTTYKSDRYIGSTYDCVGRLFIKENGVYTTDETQGIPYLESVWKNNGKKLEEKWKKNGTKMFPQSNLIKSNLDKSNLLKNYVDKKIDDVCVNDVKTSETTQNNIDETTQNISTDTKTHDKTHAKAANDEYAKRFDVFWNVYNHRKGSKAKAKQWFITHKVSEETLNDMVKAIKIDNDERDDLAIDGKFVPEKPFAQTWLNQRRWETILENCVLTPIRETKGVQGENILGETKSSPQGAENDEIDVAALFGGNK